ncbi:MAG: T9SS type A sorting domain-containing protein [Bacteroidia bacterium]
MKKRLQNSQRFGLKFKMKPLLIVLALTAVTGIMVTVLFLVFNIGTPQASSAAGNCESCDQTISGNQNGNYTVNNGQTLCITSSGYFTGSITINDGATVCNNGTFSPSSINFANDAELINHNVAELPGNFNNTGNIQNTGELAFSGNFTNSGIFESTGIIEISGNVLNSRSGGTSMEIANTVKVSGNYTNESPLINNGLLEVNGFFRNENAGSGSFINNDSLFVGSYFINGNDFTNNGGAIITGNFDNNSSGSTSLVNNGNLLIGGDVDSDQLIQNSGRFTINGNLEMSNSGNTRTINDSFFVINGNVTSNNVITNNNHMLINGIYTNQKWSGKFIVGPESLLEVDSFYNEHNIENTSTPYGQILVGNYMNNSGKIARYVDICKVNNGPAFDANTGNVDDDVTYCTNNSPLPVELIAFTAKKAEGVVLLEWATASEINNRLFEIQRKDGDDNFSKIGEIDGAGNSLSIQKYQYADASVPAGQVVYYRLRQVDYDGEYAYSKIAVLQESNAPSTEYSIKVFPNPVAANEPLNIELTGKWKAASYEIKSLAGAIVEQGNLSADGQIATTGMKPGSYLVRIYNSENSSHTKVVVR